ncbi:hypothetical protein GCM10023144_30720 [Pigmentiphaga soli]|uniref:Uncharacterized protein n=2 Tax=Pigmentiphaga soli TaxID=1007095 RepID=A0ABP8HA84_9BURK
MVDRPGLAAGYLRVRAQRRGPLAGRRDAPSGGKWLCRAGGALACAAAGATSASWADMPRFVLPAGSVETGIGHALSLAGRPADVRFFSAPMPLARLAAWLIAQAGPDATLTGLPDGALIAGRSEGWLWSVRLRDAGNRTYGIASGTELTARKAAPAPPAWLPPGAALRLDLSALDDGVRVRQQVYTFERGAADVRAALAANLAAAGWRPAAGAGSGTAAEWRLGGRRAAFVVVELPAGSGVLLQLHEDPA